MAFTALCFKYLPLYNKFRTVSMALVVLQVALPLLGFVALDRIVKGEYDSKALRKGGITTLAVTGGFCLLCALVPGLFGSFSGGADSGMQDILVEALVKDRIALFRADALRSLLFILAAAGVLFWGYRSGRRRIAAAAVCVMVLLDMFPAGKRYLNAGHFVTPKDFDKPFAERMVDKIILEDKAPQYRVLDLTVNVFNSSVPSYHHKNVGGYSPAKLQRYQDLIERYLTGEINGLYKVLSSAETLEEVSDYMAASTPVLNALNTRYVIVDGNFAPAVNDAALGAAWFVSDVVTASTPDEEIALLGSVDLAKTAVVSDGISPGALTVIPGEVEESHIELTSYAPNRLNYHYSTSEDRVAVFSEVYYPDGWTATVDGRPLELFCADWTLRAALLPQGEHDVEMYFLPKSYKTGAAVSAAASLLLMLMLLFALCAAVKKS